MISGRAFLTLAEVWSQGDSEAEWRSAISRGYYAAFHECRALLSGFGFVVPRADLAHAFLWRRLENCGVTKLATVGSRLGVLRRERNQADYDLHLTISQDTSLRAVTSAAKIINTLDALSSEDHRLATEAMKTYERDVLRETTWRNRPR